MSPHFVSSKANKRPLTRSREHGKNTRPGRVERKAEELHGRGAGRRHARRPVFGFEILLNGQPGNQRRRRMEHDARGRFQNGHVAQMAKFAAVVEVAAVKHWRHCRRGGEQNCDHCQQGGQPNRKLDQTPVHVGQARYGCKDADNGERV